MSYAAAIAFAMMLLIWLSAGPAWAATCPDCGPGGGGGDTNSPPVLSATNASVTVNERQMATNAGTFSDAEGNATVTLSASVGSVTKNDADGTWSWTFDTNDGPDQSQTVTITATDGMGETASTTFSLTVRNVAPTTSWYWSTPTQVSESDSHYSLQLIVTDPGEDGVPTPSVGCGAGGTLASVEWIGGGFDGSNRSYSYLVECTRGDGPSSAVVSASATDSDGATGNTDNHNVEVQNVAPTATLNGPDSVAEGRTATVSFTNQNDVQADKNAGLRYAFSCNGTTPLEGTTYASAGTASSTTCVAGDGGFKEGMSVRARIFDKDGGFTEYTKEISVTNVAPTATLEAPAVVDQGSNFDLSLTNVMDASSADRNKLSYAFDCGDGLGYVDSTTASKSCTALDQPNVTVKGKVTDKDGDSNEYTKTVTVNNVAPTGTIQINGGAAATNSATVSLTLSAADPLPGSGVGHMRFRNENTETWSSWEPYSTSRQWLLSEGDGAKTVHVEYRDNAGNVSTAAIQDDIVLDSRLGTTPPADTTKPKISAVSPRHKAVIRDTTPTIKATVRDNNALSKSGVKLYVAGKRIAATKYRYTASNGVLLYNSPKLAKGKKTVKVVATDAAGNVGVKSWYFTIK
jgi:hypothetical protein